MPATQSTFSLFAFPRGGRCLTGGAGLATLALLGLAPLAAHAQTAYVDTYAASTPQGPLVETFGTLDLQTGSFTFIGAVDQSLYALGFGSNGLLYGLGPDQSGGTNLYQVATNTGAESTLQDFAGFDVLGGSGNADGTFTAITSPDANGNSSFFTVDPVAGTAASVAATSASADGLAVADSLGDVYFSDYGVAGSTTDSLDVRNASGDFVLGDTGLSDVYTGLFSGGQLYTFGYDPNSFAQAEGIYTLDTTTGMATFVAPTSNDQDILASALVPAAVPEPSTTISFGLLLTLAGLAVAVKRRKVRAAA